MIALAGRTIPFARCVRRKNPQEILLVLAEFRGEAAAAMKAAFPGCLKRFEVLLLPASSLSKARKGYDCSPLFRLGICLIALWAGGADRSAAQALVNRVQEWVDRLWPEDEAPAPMAIIPRAQQVDAAEDVARTDFILNKPGARERYLHLVREQHALAPQIIRSLTALERQAS